MTCCCRLLGAKYFRSRKNSLEHPDKYLLVELRTRCKERLFLVVVLHLKRGGASFPISADQHRILILKESFISQDRSEAFDECCLKGKDISCARRAKSERQMVKI